MNTEINHQTATEWLKNHYKGVPGIWGKIDIEDAANSLEDAMTNLSTEMCGDKPATFGMDGGNGFCEVCGRGYATMNHWEQGDYDDLPTLDLMCIMADAKKTTEIHYDTAETWLENHYKDVPGIWEQFNLADAVIGIMWWWDFGCYDSFEDFSRLDLMCIMADAKM